MKKLKHVLIADEFNHWTLQYYRRMLNRFNSVKVVTFDGRWQGFVQSQDHCLLIPHDSVRRIPVKLDKEVLKKREEDYDVATAAVGEFVAEPHTDYHVSVKYSAYSDSDDKKAVLSCNFFGSEGQRDFEQVHSTLDRRKTWSTVEALVKTDYFRSDELISLRFWTLLSTPGVTVRLHDVRVSKMPHVQRTIIDAVVGAKSVMVSISDPELEPLCKWIDDSIPQAQVLSDIELYRCDMEYVEESVKTYCYRSHRNDGFSVCRVLGANHNTSSAVQGFLVEDDCIRSKDTELHICFDNDFQTGRMCFPWPVSTEFSGTISDRIAFTGSKQMVQSLEESGAYPDAAFIPKKELGPLDAKLLVIADSFNHKLVREAIYNSWSRGIVVAALTPLPPDLEKSPITSIEGSSILDFANSDLSKQRELGFLAAQSREYHCVKRDIVSAIVNNRGNQGR